jgi:hypothetical protein
MTAGDLGLLALPFCSDKDTHWRKYFCTRFFEL